MAVALASLYVFERARNWGRVGLFGAALLAGFVLSTRLSVGVVCLVYGGYILRSDWNRGLAFGGTALAVWAATWMPFALWNSKQFALEGPFAIQGLYLPSYLVLAGAGFALVLGWYAANLTAVVSRAGWLLLLLVCLSFGIAMLNGSSSVIFDDGFDIAYFILPTPFLLMTLGRQHGFSGTSANHETPREQ